MEYDRCSEKQGGSFRLQAQAEATAQRSPGEVWMSGDVSGLQSMGTRTLVSGLIRVMTGGFLRLVIPGSPALAGRGLCEQDYRLMVMETTMHGGCLINREVRLPTVLRISPGKSGTVKFSKSVFFLLPFSFT